MAHDVASELADSLEQLVALRPDGVVDTIYLVDTGSEDETGEIAASFGVTVLNAWEIHPELGPVLGKGDAIWRAAARILQQAVVFLDADLDGELRAGVREMLAALAPRGPHDFVKSFFRRSEHPRRPDGTFGGLKPGGRITERHVRPALQAHAPDVARFGEPLSGQVAITRSLLRRLPIVSGYGVEIAMLFDAIEVVGHDRVGEVDLGVIYNPPRPEAALDLTEGDVAAALEDRLARRKDPAMHRLDETRPIGHLVQRPPLDTCSQLIPWDEATA